MVSLGTGLNLDIPGEKHGGNFSCFLLRRSRLDSGLSHTCPWVPRTACEKYRMSGKYNFLHTLTNLTPPLYTTPSTLQTT